MGAHRTIFNHARKRCDALYRYVLFDLDGTLTDPWEGITRCVQFALARFGIQEAQENLTTFIGPPLRESFATRYSMSDEQAETAVEAYRERFAVTGLYENRVFDGVEALLGKLRDAGAVIALATSKPEEFARIILDHFELTPYFDVIAGASMSADRMRKDQVIEEALRRLGNPGVDDVVMVGDRVHDIEGARVFGIDAIAVSWGYAPDGSLRRRSPPASSTPSTSSRSYCSPETTPKPQHGGGRSARRSNRTRSRQGERDARPKTKREPT